MPSMMYFIHVILHQTQQYHVLGIHLATLWSYEISHRISIRMFNWLSTSQLGIHNQWESIVDTTLMFSKTSNSCLISDFGFRSRFSMGEYLTLPIVYKTQWDSFRHLSFSHSIQNYPSLQIPSSKSSFLTKFSSLTILPAQMFSTSIIWNAS